MERTNPELVLHGVGFPVEDKLLGEWEVCFAGLRVLSVAIRTNLNFNEDSGGSLGTGADSVFAGIEAAVIRAGWWGIGGSGSGSGTEVSSATGVVGAIGVEAASTASMTVFVDSESVSSPPIASGTFSLLRAVLCFFPAGGVVSLSMRRICCSKAAARSATDGVAALGARLKRWNLPGVEGARARRLCADPWHSDIVLEKRISD